MSVAEVKNFSGMVPRMDPSVLPQQNAAYARNAYLYGGAIRGFGKERAVYTLKNSAAQSVFRVPLGVGDVAITAEPSFDTSNSFWLEFSDPYMACVRNPEAEDEYDRYYFFPSDGSGATYNTKARILAGQPNFTLGIPVPASAPVATFWGGSSDTQEVRNYLVTFSSIYQEEGQPGPASNSITCPIDATVELTLPQPAATDSAGRALGFINIYRPVTDTTGNASYYRIAQVSIGTTTYVDTALDTDITANLVLPSTYWNAPPSDLQGVVCMANGILAGWSNKREVWFSEAYLPFTFPSTYALTVDQDIVGLAAMGSSLVVLTQGEPFVISGVTPDTMTQNKIVAHEPCVSRKSIVPTAMGVYYASPNGLIMCNVMGCQNVLQAIMTKENWAACQPYALWASRYGNAYIAFPGGLSGYDGFIAESATQNTMYNAAQDTMFGWIGFDVGAVTSVYYDETSGSTFVVSGGAVYEWAPSRPTELLPWVWKSKDFEFPYAQDMVAALPIFDLPSQVTVKPAATHNTDQSQTFDPTKQLLLMRVYADGKQVLVREFLASGELALMPSLKATFWAVQLEGVVRLRTWKWATSVKEMMKAA
jgi:hypothetical protein